MTLFVLFYEHNELLPRAIGDTALPTVIIPQILHHHHRMVARPLMASPACSPSSMEGSSTRSVPRWMTPSCGAQRRQTLATTTRVATGATALRTVLLQKNLDVPVEGTTLILTGACPWAIWQLLGVWTGQGWLGDRMPRRERSDGRCGSTWAVEAHSWTPNGFWQQLTAPKGSNWLNF